MCVWIAGPSLKEHGFSSTHIYGMNLRQICACLINQQGFHGDGGAGPKNGPGLYAHHDPLTAPCVNTFRGKRAEWETHLQGLQGGNTVQHPIQQERPRLHDFIKPAARRFSHFLHHPPYRLSKKCNLFIVP